MFGIVTAPSASPSPNDAGPLLLSVDDVCALTGLGRTSIYGELRAGRLASVKVGRRRLVPRAALDAWIEELPDGSA